jgi:hypothetical protein
VVFAQDSPACRCVSGSLGVDRHGMRRQVESAGVW